MRFRSVASLVLVALIAGAITAHADSASTAPRVPDTRARRCRPQPTLSRPFVGPGPLAIACTAPVPAQHRGTKTPTPRPQTPKAAAAALPSQQLLRRLRDPAPPARRPGHSCRPRPSRPCACGACRQSSLDSSRLLRGAHVGWQGVGGPGTRTSSARLGAFCGTLGKSATREGLAVVAPRRRPSAAAGRADLVRGRAPVTARPLRRPRPPDALDHRHRPRRRVRRLPDERPTGRPCAPTSTTMPTPS